MFRGTPLPSIVEVQELANSGPDQHLNDFSVPLTKLFVEMSSDDPLSRPAVSQALKRVRQLRSMLSPQTLASRVPRPPDPPCPDDEVEPKSSNNP
jgi:hypothetical protein